MLFQLIFEFITYNLSYFLPILTLSSYLKKLRYKLSVIYLLSVIFYQIECILSAFCMQQENTTIYLSNQDHMIYIFKTVKYFKSKAWEPYNFKCMQFGLIHNRWWWKSDKTEAYQILQDTQPWSDLWTTNFKTLVIFDWTGHLVCSINVTRESQYGWMDLRLRGIFTWAYFVEEKKRREIFFLTQKN
jgi:hypothetical protein